MKYLAQICFSWTISCQKVANPALEKKIYSLQHSTCIIRVSSVVVVVNIVSQACLPSWPLKCKQAKHKVVVQTKTPRFDTGYDKVGGLSQWWVGERVAGFSSAVVEVAVQPETVDSIAGTESQTLATAFDNVVVGAGPTVHLELRIVGEEQRLAGAVEMV
ncbi:hypothetical protein T4B_14291 [Trichinella pseudospiralis]|uniref:Uncharacterized protein n=1 Tax=Trichinella pseudospiralis TaxID=6337 RepID=A0A0V1IEL2_TRIPS|nr:hypothetical protein T4B_14291 [Trichinella pseudospiralis]